MKEIDCQSFLADTDAGLQECCSLHAQQTVWRTPSTVYRTVPVLHGSVFRHRKMGHVLYRTYAGRPFRPYHSTELTYHWHISFFWRVS